MKRSWLVEFSCSFLYVMLYLQKVIIHEWIYSYIFIVPIKFMVAFLKMLMILYFLFKVQGKGQVGNIAYHCMEDTVGKYSESWDTIIHFTCISTKSVLFFKVEYSVFLVNPVLCEEYFWWTMGHTVTFRLASTSSSQSALGHYVQEKNIYIKHCIIYIFLFYFSITI